MSRRFPLSLLAIGAVTLAAPAFAESTGLDAAFGNTIVSTYPDGRIGRLWLQKDGGYKAEGRRHDPSSGRWTVSDGKLCLKQQRPFPAPFRFCTPIIQGGIGATWSAKAVSGEPIQVKVVRGTG